jgi:PAS domain S-box-containing protein
MSSFSRTPEKNASLRQRLAELEKENEQLRNQLASQQETETVLRESEQQFRKIFNASNDAIFVIDPQRDRILEANPQAEKLLGYSRQELLTSVSISKVHPEEMPQFLAFTRKILTLGQGWTNELTCLSKSGKSFLWGFLRLCFNFNLVLV